MGNPYQTEYSTIETNYSHEDVVQKGKTFTSPSVKSFEAYAQPLVLKKGDGCYLWDVNDKKYVDLMAQNLCVSVGYNYRIVNS